MGKMVNKDGTINKIRGFINININCKELSPKLEEKLCDYCDKCSKFLESVPQLNETILKIDKNQEGLLDAVKAMVKADVAEQLAKIPKRFDKKNDPAAVKAAVEAAVEAEIDNLAQQINGLDGIIRQFAAKSEQNTRDIISQLENSNNVFGKQLAHILKEVDQIKANDEEMSKKLDALKSDFESRSKNVDDKVADLFDFLGNIEKKVDKIDDTTTKILDRDIEREAEENRTKSAALKQILDFLKADPPRVKELQDYCKTYHEQLPIAGFLSEFISNRQNLPNLKRIITKAKDNSEITKYAEEILDFYCHATYEFQYLTGNTLEECFISKIAQERQAEYKTKLEEAAFLLNSGRYRCDIPRDVFIAHASDDYESIVKPLVEQLKKHGITCFVSEENLPNDGMTENTQYCDDLKTAIANCRIFLLVSTQKSMSTLCGVFDEIKYVEEYDYNRLMNGYDDLLPLEWKCDKEKFMSAYQYKNIANMIGGYEKGKEALNYVMKQRVEYMPNPTADEKMRNNAVHIGRFFGTIKYQKNQDYVIQLILNIIDNIETHESNYKAVEPPRQKTVDEPNTPPAGMEAAAEEPAPEETSAPDANPAAAPQQKPQDRSTADAGKSAKTAERKKPEIPAGTAGPDPQKEAQKMRDAANAISRGFGMYPQSRVTDQKSIVTLNVIAPFNKETKKKWICYPYYIKRKQQDFMYYRDIAYNGAKYRGVYFKKYRPYYTGNGSKDNYQQYNGYKSGTVYWFKWEPIKWRVLNVEGNVALLHADMILDSQHFYHNYFHRTRNGKTVYPNNYEHSDIRAWLNDTFLRQAFSDNEKAIILTTAVDNSASTTWTSDNKYACTNTNDKVFLLSCKDVVNKDYGFNAPYNVSDGTRCRKVTDYAACQGAYVNASNGWWWLRSPDSNYSDCACVVYSDGFANYHSYVSDASGGVVPALKITLKG